MSNKLLKNQVSEHLPFEARTRLIRATQTRIPDDDPLARVRAIDEASTFAKTHYPRYFQKDPS